MYRVEVEDIGMGMHRRTVPPLIASICPLGIHLTCLWGKPLPELSALRTGVEQDDLGTTWVGESHRITEKAWL